MTVATTKLCRKCLRDLPPADFRKNRANPDGLQRFCRTCHVAANRASRQAHPEVHRARRLRWWAKNPEKRRVHRALNKAVQRGKVVRSEACENCGARPPLQAHHEDYNRRFDVTWLCPQCHVNLHNAPAPPEVSP